MLMLLITMSLFVKLPVDIEAIAPQQAAGSEHRICLQLCLRCAVTTSALSTVSLLACLLVQVLANCQLRAGVGLALALRFCVSGGLCGGRTRPRRLSSPCQMCGWAVWADGPSSSCGAQLFPLKWLLNCSSRVAPDLGVPLDEPDRDHDE
jgi:hypothetical protein